MHGKTYIKCTKYNFTDHLHVESVKFESTKNVRLAWKVDRSFFKNFDFACPKIMESR